MDLGKDIANARLQNFDFKSSLSMDTFSKRMNGDGVAGRYDLRKLGTYRRVNRSQWKM